MSGSDESTKTAVTEPGETTTPSANGADAQPKVRLPRDSSGEMIAVEVSQAEGLPTADAAPAGDAEPSGDADPVADLTAQLEKKQEQLLRVAADFDNYKKRARRDASEAAFQARNEILQDILPVIDNVELALAHSAEGAEGEADLESLREGMQMVLKQFHSVMEKHRVKPLDSLGQPFDPSFHEALQQRETEDHPPGTVVEEFRRGYMMGDRLIRPAMVVVAAAPAGAPEGRDDEESQSTSGEGSES